jgi:7-dehydrocholesterol reductase
MIGGVCGRMLADTKANSRVCVMDAGQSRGAAQPPVTNARDVLRLVLIPLVVMATLPVMTILLWLIIRHFNGSVAEFAAKATVAGVIRIWPWPSAIAVEIIALWVALQTFLLLTLPGRRHLGPLTPTGDRVAYKLNGIPALLTTLACFYLAAYRLEWFSPTIVYDHLGEILMTSSVIAIACSMLLCIKGLRAPSSRDAGTSGFLVWDFYWGTELHPRVGGIDLKQLVICRLAMMGWGVIVLSCIAKQIEVRGHLADSMAVSAGLQLLYIFKFFCWEGGYFHTLDVMHYRFGFRNVWGVTTWLPAVYPIAALWLVDHPKELGPVIAALIVALGVAAIWANYDADAQRQRARATAGRTTVWGRKPAILHATYTTPDRVRRETLLLMSGWWGLSRHFHYLPEIAIAVSWTLPAGSDAILPWFYVGYLVALLVHRAAYDDQRCREKYGHHWQTYCASVPYRLIPFVY